MNDEKDEQDVVGPQDGPTENFLASRPPSNHEEHSGVEAPLSLTAESASSAGVSSAGKTDRPSSSPPRGIESPLSARSSSRAGTARAPRRRRPYLEGGVAIALVALLTGIFAATASTSASSPLARPASLPVQGVVAGSGYASNQPIVLRWKHVKGAESYKLQWLASSRKFGTSAEALAQLQKRHAQYPSPNARATSYRLSTNVLGEQWYYWREVAIQGGTYGPWSTVKSFHVMAPVIAAPSHLLVNGIKPGARRVQLCWNTASGAVSGHDRVWVNGKASTGTIGAGRGGQLCSTIAVTPGKSYGWQVQEQVQGVKLYSGPVAAANFRVPVPPTPTPRPTATPAPPVATPYIPPPTPQINQPVATSVPIPYPTPVPQQPTPVPVPPTRVPPITVPSCTVNC